MMLNNNEHIHFYNHYFNFLNRLELRSCLFSEEELHFNIEHLPVFNQSNVFMNIPTAVFITINSNMSMCGIPVSLVIRSNRVNRIIINLKANILKNFPILCRMFSILLKSIAFYFVSVSNL